MVPLHLVDSTLTVVAADAPHSVLRQIWHWIEPFISFWNVGVPSSLLVAAIFYYHKQISEWWKERRESRDPQVLHLWDLIPRRASKKKIDAAAFLAAVNRGAADASKRGFEGSSVANDNPSWLRHPLKRAGLTTSFALRPSKAELVWRPVFSKLKSAQSLFVGPEYIATQHGRTVSNGNANHSGSVAKIREWLEESVTSADGDDAAGQIWVVGSGRAGKSTFMNRLFLDLIGATETTRVDGDERLSATPANTPVPMLAAAENLRTHAKLIARLRAEKDSPTAFVTVWLSIRRIKIPANVKDDLVAAVKDALIEGKALLLLDGVDELVHEELEVFAGNLLRDVKFWVASTRPGLEIVPTNYSIRLDEVLSIEKIDRRLDRRFPDPPPGAPADPMVHARESLKVLIRELIERHHESADEALGEQEHHWLCESGNLANFMDAMATERLTDEREIRRRAESQAYLFGGIFKHAVDRIDAGAHIAAIRERLFTLAAGDRPSAQPQPHDETTARVLQLTEIVHETTRGPAFKHPAMRDYFLAGKIAREIIDPVAESTENSELKRTEEWDAARHDAVLSWFNDLPGRAAERIRARLRRRGESRTSPINPVMRRNLLQLLLTLEPTGELNELDLSAIPGSGINLVTATAKSCSFRNAQLRDAELAGATFVDCDFSGADLSSADAFDAKFDNCDFGADGSHAIVNGMAIAHAVFESRNETDPREVLTERGARDERSRYRSEFGKRWAEFQKAALAPGLNRLEDGAYLPAIEAAIRSATARAPAAPVYMVDVMAGGSYRRVTELLSKFEQLRVLGIDKDDLDPSLPVTESVAHRLAWRCKELGKNTSDRAELGIDFREALTSAFGDSAFPADCIVGKKAIHELRFPLQKQLLTECANALRDGGRLVLFVDAPGPTDKEDLDRKLLNDVHADIARIRQRLVASRSSSSAVESELDKLKFDGSPTSQIGFTNIWIMLKDWANQNRHEYENRYFASIAELREWAAECFDDAEPQLDHYRLNPMMFNELGISRVFEHVERESGEGLTKEAVVRRDRRKLQGWLGENKRLDVLIDFARTHLDGTPLGRALGAEQSPISLRSLDPALAPLDTGTKAWSFKLTCGVLSFSRGRA